LLTSAAAFAHHSFAAEYDRDAKVSITGTIKKVEWMNPHARFYVDAKDASGNTVTWNFELASPKTLMRRGWSRNFLKPGDTVTVVGWSARKDPHVADTQSVKRSDGKLMYSRKSLD
jgi:hypothetical protein